MKSLLSAFALGLAAASLFAQTATRASAGSAAAQPVVVPYAPPSHAAILGSTIVDWDSLALRTTALGQVRAVFDNPTSTLDKLESHITTLNPGMASHPVHRHPWEEIIYLRQGTLDVNVDGRKLHARPGALIFLASNDPHNLVNTGPTPAIYYIIDFVTAIASNPAAANAPSAAQQNLPGKLASTVIDCSSLPVTPTPTGSRASVVDSPTLTFSSFSSHITTLNPGQTTARDMIDSGDEVVILKSGTVEVTVNGVSSRIAAGSMLYWAPNDKRTVRNLGATPASYQVFKVLSAKSPRSPAN